MSCDHELGNEGVRCSGRNASYITMTPVLFGGCNIFCQKENAHLVAHVNKNLPVQQKLNINRVTRILQTTQNLAISLFSLQRTANKCITIYNARAQLLFCSLYHLFAAAFVVCLSSLLASGTCFSGCYRCGEVAGVG